MPGEIVDIAIIFLLQDVAHMWGGMWKRVEKKPRQCGKDSGKSNKNPLTKDGEIFSKLPQLILAFSMEEVQ